MDPDPRSLCYRHPDPIIVWSTKAARCMVPKWGVCCKTGWVLPCRAAPCWTTFKGERLERRHPILWRWVLLGLASYYASIWDLPPWMKVLTELTRPDCGPWLRSWHLCRSLKGDRCNASPESRLTRPWRWGAGAKSLATAGCGIGYQSDAHSDHQFLWQGRASQGIAGAAWG